MTVGLEITNNNGSVVITSEHKLQIVSERGTFGVYSSKTDRPGYGTAYFKRPITTSTTPAIFVRYVSGNYPSCRVYFRLIGGPGNWVGFTVVAGATGTIQNHTFEYVACKYVDQMSSSRCGFQLFNETGDILYDSNFRPVKYSKIANYWTYQYLDTFYCQFNANVAIAVDDYISISQMDRGPLFAAGSNNMYTGLTLKSGWGLALSVYCQFRNTPQNVEVNAANRWCLPICKFPLSVYPDD